MKEQLTTRKKWLEAQGCRPCIGKNQRVVLLCKAMTQTVVKAVNTIGTAAIKQTKDSENNITKVINEKMDPCKTILDAGLGEDTRSSEELWIAASTQNALLRARARAKAKVEKKEAKEKEKLDSRCKPKKTQNSAYACYMAAHRGEKLTMKAGAQKWKAPPDTLSQIIVLHFIE